MRLLRKAFYVIAMFLLVSRGTPGGQPYIPPPFPDDLPFPDDPPPIFDDPFDPINDLPDPFDLPFPPEVDLPPLPDPWDLPDPPDLPDPFPDEPSLIPDPFDELPDPFDDLPPLPPPASPIAGMVQAPAVAATTLVSKLMPFPMRIPFHPSYSGKNAPQTARNCNAGFASQLIIPDSLKNTVGFFGTCPPQRTATVTVGTFPVRAAPTPEGTRVLVANYGDGNTSGSISAVDVATHVVSKTISFPAADANGSPVAPNNIAFLPDGSRAYITSHACNPGSFIYIVDMSSLSVTGTIPVGCYPSAIAVTPDGSQVWVSEHGDSRVDIFDTTTNASVFAYNIATPNGIAFNPTGTMAYIAQGTSPGIIMVINAQTYAPVTQIPVGNLPHVVRVTPTGHSLFVANVLSNSISQIDTTTNTVTRTLTLPNGAQHPLGLAFIH